MLVAVEHIRHVVAASFFRIPMSGDMPRTLTQRLLGSRSTQLYGGGGGGASRGRGSIRPLAQKAFIMEDEK
ncbi:hypothetical protein MY5147_008217 [Beauveria neobassiana]